LSNIHGLHKVAIILYRDAEHKFELYDGDDLKDVTTIYWAFEGDSPSNWLYKQSIILNSLQRIQSHVTEDLLANSFQLEKEYSFTTPVLEEQKKEWLDIVLPTRDTQPPYLPLQIKDGVYNTDPKNLKVAYEEQNPGWKETMEKIKSRIKVIRTDKKQYETNLQNLEKNHIMLREEIQSLTGTLYPPLPDTLLYTSSFHSIIPENVKTGANDHTWLALTSAIEANNVYFQQQLGKYNFLKKEECHLVSIYTQLTTRMRLWIFRERLRFLQWELENSDIFGDTDLTLKLKSFETLKALEYKIEEKVPKRSYQCIDFCSCEVGCSSTARIKRKKS
jgi:hypothetical protein